MSIRRGIHQLSLIELLTERDIILTYQSEDHYDPRSANRENDNQTKRIISTLKFMLKTMFSSKIAPTRPHFDLEAINTEIERRHPSENEINEASRIKEEIQKTRNKRANKGLSPLMKISIFLVPEIVFSKKDHTGPSLSAWEDEDSFLQQAGYQKLVKQRFRLAIIGMGFRLTLFAILFFWWKYKN